MPTARHAPLPHKLFSAAVLAWVAFSNRAVAAEHRPNPASTETPSQKGEDSERLPAKKRISPRILGATLDVGIPDGAIAGVVGRPLHWLRVAAGAGTNAVSPGLRAGLTLIPLGTGPSATIEGGHYFDGNANETVSAFAGSSYEGSRMAERIGYQFVNLHLGLDFGEERFTFFLHGGMSYLHTTLHNVDDALGSTSDGLTTVSITSDPVVTAWIPSLKLGFIFYLV